MAEVNIDPKSPQGRKNQKKLKTARAEIEAVLKKHGIAGYVVLHSPGWSEVFWNIWPHYSILKGDFPEIRIKSALADYGGNVVKQLEDQAATANMMHHFAEALLGCTPQFVELAQVLNAKLNSEHTFATHVPDPNKSNPGVH